MNPKLEILKNSILFYILNDTQLKLIAPITKLKKIPAKTTFIPQDTLSECMYSIHQGAVRVYTLSEEGKEITTSLRGKGELVGLLSLMGNEKHASNVETLEETTLLVISKNDFRKIIYDFPEIAINIVQYLSQSMRMNNKNLETILSKNLEERTLSILNILKDLFRDKSIPLTHEEIAQIVGATRARVTEVLNNLEKQHKIIMSHKKISLI